MENFIYTFNVDKKLCDDLIIYHNENEEYKNVGVSGNGEINKTRKDSIDVTTTFFNRNKSIKKYFEILDKNIFLYKKKYNLSNLNFVFDNFSVIQKYLPSGGFKQYHYERSNGKNIDNRELVFMTYLNTVENSGTEWIYQNFKSECIKGKSYIWPAGFTHTHRGMVNYEKEKFIITGWINLA